MRTHLEVDYGSYMFLTKTVEMNKIKDKSINIYMKNNILRLKNIIETRIGEENVGHRKDTHPLLIALTVM